MGVHRPFYVDSPSTLDDNGDEGDFAVDPDQLHDKLPQPFRLVDKILNGLFEDAWSLIAKRQNDMDFEASRRHLPKVDGGVKVVLPYPLHCMNTTSDGKLLLAVGKGGAMAFTGEDPTRPVYKLNNESGGYLQIDSTQGSEPSTYIAATLDPQGMVTLFGITRAGFFTIAELQNQEGDVALHVQMHENTLAVTVIDQKDDCSLVFYTLPIGTWCDPLEESTTARLQGNSEGGVLFTKPDVKGRIRAPSPVTPCSKNNVYEALNPIMSTINNPVPLGLGNHHILSKQYFDSRRELLEKLPKYRGIDWDTADKSDKIGSVMFTEAGQVLVWWSDHPTATLHSLTSNDLEVPLDSFMFSSPITCVEGKAGLMAVGLQTGLVSVIRLSDGITLQTTLTARSPVTKLRFIGSRVLASCEDGRVSVLSGEVEGSCASIQHISSNKSFQPSQLLHVPAFSNIAVACLTPSRVCILDVESFRAFASLPTSKIKPYCGMLDEKLVYVGERDVNGLHIQLTALHSLGPRVHRLSTVTEVEDLKLEMHVFDLSRDHLVTEVAIPTGETLDSGIATSIDQLSQMYFTKREAERGTRHERQRERWFQFTEELECY